MFYIFSAGLFYYSKEVNYEELARCTDDFNGAQLKAVCVEAVSSCSYQTSRSKSMVKVGDLILLAETSLSFSFLAPFSMEIG